MGTGNTEELNAYLDAYRIRKVELEIARRYHLDGESPMKCPTHLSIGAEHLAVAVARTMPQGTKAYSTHRSHAHYLAWGGDLRKMLAELHGRQTGCAGGWGGSMHLVDEAAGFMGTSAIVGSSLSYAAGSALAAQLEGSDRWTVAFVGDAVPETGQFWEVVNFAELKQLNLMIVIEDNGLATATYREDRQPGTLLEGIVGSLELEEIGTEASYQAIAIHFEWLKECAGLHIIRGAVDRYFTHVGPGLDDWRDAPEVWGPEDPVRKMAEASGVYDIQQIANIEREINSAFEQVGQDPWPDDLPGLFIGGRNDVWNQKSTS